MLNVARAVRAGVVCVGVMSGAALGQSLQTLPPANDAVAGGTNNVIPLAAGTGGRHLTLFGPELLTGIPVGSVITGLQLRQRNLESVAWPASNTNVTDFEIWLSQSTKTPATMSNTFSDNILNPVRVRDGALALTAGVYPAGAATGTTPEGWGPVLAFQTKYLYKGGVLAVEFRNTGGGAPLHGADCSVNSAGSTGMGATPDPNSVTGIINGAVIVRLTFTPPPTDLARGVTKVITNERFANLSSTWGQNSTVQTTARTQMSVTNPSEFDTIGPGSQFVGLAWRQTDEAEAAWPLSDASFTRYDVQLSKSQNPAGLLSTTVASNVGTDAVMVRSGAMTIPLGSFGVKGSELTAPFGFEVAFTTPYQYVGGPLLSVIRHDGQNSGLASLMDSTSTSDPEYNTLVQAFRTTDSNAVTTPTTSSVETTMYSVDAGTMSPLDRPQPENGFIGEMPQQLQTILSASELKYIPVGSVIDSLWLRARSGLEASPSADVFADNLEVTLSSAANQPAAASLTFGSNEGADKVTVRSGPFALGAGAFPAGGAGIYGKLVQFQKHFVYKGGPLCVTVRFTGLSGGSFAKVECVFGTGATNRTIFSFSDGPTGAFLGGFYTGTAMKLGYIPSVMTPNKLATAGGSSSWGLSTVSNYAVQTIIPADQLRSVDVGSAITGLSLRASQLNSVSIPAVATDLSRFDISIAPAARSATSISTTFALNQGPGAVLVRSGPLTVPAGAYPTGLTPNNNAWYIQFSRAYVYTGGDLCITMRGSGAITGLGQYFEGDSGAPQSFGASIYEYSNADAATGSKWGPLGIRLAFTARAFCPWDLNNDGNVDDADFLIFVAAYNTLDCTDPAMAQGCPADFNYDRLVDDTDFTLFIGPYNTLTCP